MNWTEIFATLVTGLLAGGTSTVDCAASNSDQAIRGCSKIIESGRISGRPASSTDLAIVHTNRAKAFWDKKLPDRAIADLDRAIELNPKDDLAYTYRGLSLATKGKLERAVSEFGQAIDLNPNNADAFFYRGEIYEKKRDFTRAIADYSRSIELNPNDAHVRNVRGYTLLRTERSKEAVEDFLIATQLQPKEAAFHHSLGEGLYYMGREKAAIGQWRKVCDLAKAEDTKDWQKELSKLGHYSGAADGKCGPDMIEAFRSCSKSKCRF